jgi:hypothetical protein
MCNNYQTSFLKSYGSLLNISGGQYSGVPISLIVPAFNRILERPKSPIFNSLCLTKIFLQIKHVKCLYLSAIFNSRWF